MLHAAARVSSSHSEVCQAGNISLASAHPHADEAAVASHDTIINYTSETLACPAIRGVSIATENNSPRAAPAPNPSHRCVRGGPGKTQSPALPSNPPAPPPPSLIDNSGGLCGNSSLPSRESSPETDTNALGPRELSLAQAPPALRHPPAPSQKRQMARLIWAAAMRRGAARLLLPCPPSPSLVFVWPRGGRSERVHHQPIFDKHSGAGYLEVFTEGPKVSKENMGGGGEPHRRLPKPSTQPHRGALEWEARMTMGQCSCPPEKVYHPREKERDRDVGRERGCGNQRGGLCRPNLPGQIDSSPR